VQPHRQQPTRLPHPWDLQARTLEWVAISFSIALIENYILVMFLIFIMSRNITLSTMVHLVKAMVFPVVIYGCESWTIKKAEH